MSKVKNIEFLSEIIDKYDLLILDQWGVMHDGKQGYKEAINCVKKLVELKKNLVIISNSSKRKETTIDRLPQLGFDHNNFAEVMTSGEIVWQNLKNKSNKFFKNLGNNCFHIYDETKEDGIKYTDGLKYNFVKKIKYADFILGCTPSPGLRTLDYVPILEESLKKNIPFICANPDYETIESSDKKLNICMGAVAELYKEYGGEVLILGKPSKEIYKSATKKFKSIKKNRILAIGDSIYHDIQGASNFGVDSLLITSGIHKDIFNKSNLKWDIKNDYFNNFKIKPTYLSNNFQF